MEQTILEKFKDKIINGKEISDFVKFELQQKILNEKIHKNLAVILIGDNENSKTYIRLKNKFANDIGVGFHVYYMTENDTENDILESLNFLNNDDEIDGILIQLPISKKFNSEKILSAINKKKDVDGFLNGSSFEPVMGHVISKILLEIDENIENKNVSIICNSDIFSEKIDSYLKSKYKNINVDKNIYDKNNLENIKESTKKADLIISIVGEKNFIKSDFIKENSIIIDIGITKENDKIFGDADMEDVIKKVKYITPPIGGVGPITVAMLFDNLVNKK